MILTRETSRNTSFLSAFGSAMKGMIDQQKIAEKLTPHQALSIWPEIAGEQIARACEAEAVRGKTLYVRAKSSVWANELTFHKPDLLRKLNERLAVLSGADSVAIIEEIFFSTGNRPASPVRTKLKKESVIVQPPDLSDVGPPKVPNFSDNGEARLEFLVARTHSILQWKRENGWIECSRCRALYEPEQVTIPKRSGKSRKQRDVCPVCRTLMMR